MSEHILRVGDQYRTGCSRYLSFLRQSHEIFTRLCGIGLRRNSDLHNAAKYPLFFSMYRRPQFTAKHTRITAGCKFTNGYTGHERDNKIKLHAIYLFIFFVGMKASFGQSFFNKEKTVILLLTIRRGY